MTLHIFLNGIVIDIESTQKIDNYILYVIIASLKSETTNHANRKPDSPLLISSLPGSASRMHVESLGSLAMSTSVLKALPGKLDIKRHSPSILYILCLYLTSLSAVLLKCISVIAK